MYKIWYINIPYSYVKKQVYIRILRVLPWWWCNHVCTENLNSLVVSAFEHISVEGVLVISDFSHLVILVCMFLGVSDFSFVFTSC